MAKSKINSELVAGGQNGDRVPKPLKVTMRPGRTVGMEIKYKLLQNVVCPLQVSKRAHWYWIK